MDLRPLIWSLRAASQAEISSSESIRASALVLSERTKMHGARYFKAHGQCFNRAEVGTLVEDCCKCALREGQKLIATLNASTSSSVADSMMPLFFRHANRTPWWGTLCPLDIPSNRPPSGARGHRVILTREAAEEALPSLMGMAIDYTPGWDGHDSRRKIGVITMARIKNSKIQVGGYYYERDFPEIERTLRNGDFGMSYETADAHVENMGTDIWVLTKIGSFTGAAVLKREKAAYRNTKFELG